MSNLSVLHRNMLATMSDDAATIYLRGLDRDEWAACQAAWEWDQVNAVLRPAIEAALRAHKAPVDAGTDVPDFIRERQFRRYFPDGRSTQTQSPSEKQR